MKQLTAALRRPRGAGNLNVLLLLSGVLGVVLGITNATWQVSVETAQVLTGFVHYDKTSLGYAYNISVFSALNYLTAGILVLTRSEFAASIIICGLTGMLAMQTLAMTVFMALRNAYAATLAAVGVTLFHLYGFGIAYPIILFGSSHTFGRVGFFFALFAALLLGLGRFRSGSFAAGLALAVHPSWGIWLGLCLALTVIIRRTELLPVFRASIGWYIAGAVLSCGLFVLHRMLFPPGLSAAAPDSSKELFLGYIRYWDYHRQPFTSAWHLSRELFYVVLTSAIAFRQGRRKDLSPGESFFFSFLLVTSGLSLFFVFIPSWLDPALFPQWLIALMPGRFVNLSIFIALPLLIGFRLNERLSTDALFRIGALWLALVLLFFDIPIALPMGPRQLGLVLSAGIVAWPKWSRNFFPRDAAGTEPSPWILVATLLLILYSPFYLRAMTPPPLIREAFAVVQPTDLRGTVLVTAENMAYQVPARVPTISPMLDGYAYAGPGALIKMNAMMDRIYAVSLANGPPELGARHLGIIPTAEYEQEWARRSCGDWEKLSREFGFAHVLAPRRIHLQLPRVGYAGNGDLYSPTCAPHVP